MLHILAYNTSSYTIVHMVVWTDNILYTISSTLEAPRPCSEPEEKVERFQDESEKMKNRWLLWELTQLERATEQTSKKSED